MVDDPCAFAYIYIAFLVFKKKKSKMTLSSFHDTQNITDMLPYPGL